MKLIKNFSIAFFICLFASTITITASTRLKQSLTVRDEFYIYVDELYDINIKNKVPKSTYQWTSSDSKNITVNKKNGVITANSVGSSVVSCTIKEPNGNTVVLSAIINVIKIPEFFNYGTMAHAMGGYEGNKYNNTKEALELSYSNGFRFIETDLILTKDNKVVAMHGWNQSSYEHIGVKFDKENPVLTYDEFMNTKVQSKYSTVDLQYIIEVMRNNKDLYFEFDVKATDKKSATLITEEIIRLSNNDTSILDRILMQFISEDAYFAMDEVYSFKYYQYFAFKRHSENIEEVIKFCKENNITSVAVNYKNLTDDILLSLKQNGILVLTHTIDDVDLKKEFLDKGVNIVCTNFITPDYIK